MSAGAQALSAGLGALVGAGAAAGVAAGIAAATRSARTLGGGVAAASGLRLAGAVAGITAGVLMKPPVVATFVLAFLVIYLAGQAVLIFGTGRRRPGS